ncbi:NUDIX hydrolase [Hutsoniella sourekii]|uniref:NUDIX hydrolase n=1 Tax=Hutsoniella sourekii TaxID=87650 RepID=UPI000483F582|nr:8-oxo-dGTP diphosphatase [Hutsoniella sourekii]
MTQQLSTICYLDNGKQLLLLHRNKKENDIHEGKWVSVGGKFEAGETPEACAIREIREETGLIADKLDLLGFITFPDFKHDGQDWYSFVYRVSEFHGELIEDCDEGTLAWVDYQDVMKKPTWEGDYLYLEWILNGSPFFSASFTYDLEGELADHHVTFYE